MIEMTWTHGLTGHEMSRVLLEYRYFVHRFTSWLAFAIARTPYERVRLLRFRTLWTNAASWKARRRT